MSFESPSELEALRLSLKVGFWNLVIGLPLAVALAWLLARRRFPGKELLNGLVHLSLILPPVVTGYLLLLLLGWRGPIGARSRTGSGSWWRSAGPAPRSRPRSWRSR